MLPPSPTVREVQPRKRPDLPTVTAQVSQTSTLTLLPPSLPLPASNTQTPSNQSGARPKEPAPIKTPQQQTSPKSNPAKKTVTTGRAPKGSNDPVRLYNKFGNLGSQEELPDPKNSKPGSTKGGGKHPPIK